MREPARMSAAEAEMLAKQLDKLFRAGLKVPVGHEYRFDIKKETACYPGGPGSSISAFIKRVEDDKNESGQVHVVHVEIRVYLDGPRTILFARHGKQHDFLARDLLTSRQKFAYAKTYEELGRIVVERINGVLELIVGAERPSELISGETG